MAAKDRVRERNLGMAPMTPSAGFAVLDKLLDSGLSEVCVLPLNSWAAFFAAHPFQDDEPFFAAVRPARAPALGVAASEANHIDRLRGLAADDRRQALIEYVREQLAKVLGADTLEPIPTTTPFQERGLNSLMSVELRNQLARSLRLHLPTTVLLDYPTLDALCDHLLSEYLSSEPDPTEPPDDAAMIAAMSEADAEAMLRRELEDLDV